MFITYIIKGEILKFYFFCIEMNSYKVLESQAIIRTHSSSTFINDSSMEIFILASVTFFTEEEFHIMDDFFQVTAWVCTLTLLSQKYFSFHGLGHYTSFPGLQYLYKQKHIVEKYRGDSLPLKSYYP